MFGGVQQASQYAPPHRGEACGLGQGPSVRRCEGAGQRCLSPRRRLVFSGALVGEPEIDRFERLVDPAEVTLDANATLHCKLREVLHHVRRAVFAGVEDFKEARKGLERSVLVVLRRRTVKLEALLRREAVVLLPQRADPLGQGPI